MKLDLSKQRNQALTRIDVVVAVLVAIFLLALFSVILLPGNPSYRHATRINCVSNLKRTAVAALVWNSDHGNQYPMSVSVTNGGGMEWIATGDIASCFRVMSNELGTTKVLVCPADRDRVAATNFSTGFDNSHISYFVNADANINYPQLLFMGDDNLTANGIPVKSGILEVTTNTQISWTKDRHGNGGNLSFADGSVAEESTFGLRNALQYSVQGTPFTTNRIAIP